MAAAIVLLLAMLAPSLGNTTKVIKRADLLRGTATIALKEGQEVAEGDKIRTQSSGRARIVLSDGSILTVGASSLLTIRAASESARAGSLDMAYGKVRAVITPSATGGKGFEIRTATAVCGVLGTTLFVDGTRNITRIANLTDDTTSRVRVTTPRGEVVLQPGQGTSVPLNGAPQPPRRWSPEEVRAANQDTDIP